MRLLRAQNRLQFPSTRVTGTQSYPERRSVLPVAATQSVGHCLGDHTRIREGALKMYSTVVSTLQSRALATPRLEAPIHTPCSSFEVRHTTLPIDPCNFSRLSAMSSSDSHHYDGSAMSVDPQHHDEQSMSIDTGRSAEFSDVQVDDATLAAVLEHATFSGDDDDETTEYSEFCDDETIWAAPATTTSYESAEPSTSLGKRKSLEDPQPSGSLSASYKRQTISSDGGAEPYIIVGFIKSFPSVPNSSTGAQHQRPTGDGLPRTSVGRSMGGRASRLTRPLHVE